MTIPARAVRRDQLILSWLFGAEETVVPNLDFAKLPGTLAVSARVGEAFETDGTWQVVDTVGGWVEVTALVLFELYAELNQVELSFALNDIALPTSNERRGGPVVTPVALGVVACARAYHEYFLDAGDFVEPKALVAGTGAAELRIVGGGMRIKRIRQ